MQSNQQNHSKLLTVILAGVASIGFAAAASAAGGTLGTNTHVGAGAQTAPASGTSIGGAADARMNASGNTNSNAQWKDTASQGLGRAQDRVGTAQDRVSTQAAAGGMLGTNNQVGAGAQTAPAPGTPIGGAADARMNASGNINSNAQWKDTATQGVERAQDRVGTSQDRVSTQAEVMRTQAQSQAEEQKAQAQSQAEQMKLQGQSMKPTPQGQLGVMSSKTAKKKH